MLAVIFTVQIHSSFYDHTGALVVNTGAGLLHIETATVLGEGLENFQSLFAVNNLVRVVWRHAGKRLALRALGKYIDIVVIALERQDKRVCWERCKVTIFPGRQISSMSKRCSRE